VRSLCQQGTNHLDQPATAHAVNCVSAINFSAFTDSGLLISSSVLASFRYFPPLQVGEAKDIVPTSSVSPYVCVCVCIYVTLSLFMIKTKNTGAISPNFL